MKPKRYTAQNIFKEFRNRYPTMWRRGSDCRLIDQMKILIMAPGLGKFTYEYFGHKITWIERWVDDKTVKQAEKEMRHKNYMCFVSLLEDFMDKTGYTQGDISEATGVSRQSINKYMSGKSVPKMKTMRMISEKLGLDFES